MIFSRTKGWIGVDIGTHTIKLAQVERHGSRVELIEALSIPRQEAWLQDETAPEDISSSHEIQAALSLGPRFRGREAAVTLPMAVCDFRACKVAGNTDAERQVGVVEELKTVYPDTYNEREVGHWSIEVPADKGTGGDNTIAFSLPSAWADRAAQDMREAGLVGNVLDALPLAMARSISLAFPNAANPIAAVDWGYQRATLCSVKGGRPLFVRSLRDCGFHTVTRALCRSLSVTQEEAQKLLHDHGLPNPAQSAPTDLQSVIEEVTREPLDSFMDELNRTAEFLKFQRRRIAPAKIVLLGGGAAVKNIGSYLNEHVDLPVDTWALDSKRTRPSAGPQIAIELFGPAVALSSLAWANT